jgi:hypothetical protein
MATSSQHARNKSRRTEKFFLEPTDTAKRSTQTYVSYKSRTCLSDSVSDSGASEKETHQRQKPKQRWRPSGGTRTVRTRWDVRTPLRNLIS